jgi:hypothetical protein
VTNTRRHPPTRPRPPTICNTLVATPRTLIVGRRTTIRAHVTADGKPVLGARVTLTGLGAFDQRYTDANGTARFPITPAKSGILTLTTQRQFGCRDAAKDRIRAIIVKPKPPAVTG